jgi:hypothetical protein
MGGPIDGHPLSAPFSVAETLVATGRTVQAKHLPVVRNAPADFHFLGRHAFFGGGAATRGPQTVCSEGRRPRHEGGEAPGPRGGYVPPMMVEVRVGAALLGHGVRERGVLEPICLRIVFYAHVEGYDESEPRPLQLKAEQGFSMEP